jgi:hypothetical protein
MVALRVSFLWIIFGMGCACCSPQIHAEESFGTSLQMDGGEASFDGDTLTVSDGVQLQHTWGKVTAQSMVVLPGGAADMLGMSKVQLTGNVELALVNGSTISSSYAEFDLVGGKGHLFGNDQDQPVVYRQVATDGHPAVHLTSGEATFEWQRGAAHDSLSWIAQLTCHRDVRLKIDDSFEVRGGTAFYRPSVSLTTGSMLTLLPANKSEYCLIQDKAGNSLQAMQLTYDVQQGLLKADAPQGIVSIGQGEQSQPAAFSCGSACWNSKDNTLVLSGGTSVSIKNKGELQADGDVVIKRTQIPGQPPCWSSMVTEGFTQIHYHGLSDGTLQQLTCRGRTFVNHDTRKAILEAFPNTELQYQDANALLYGNRLELSYATDKGIIELQEAVLTGQVRLINGMLPTDLAGHGEPWQYLWAERLDYLATDQLLSFSATPPQRVAYYDKINSLRASAPRILIQRAAGGQFALRAEGATRFAFAERCPRPSPLTPSTANSLELIHE